MSHKECCMETIVVTYDIDDDNERRIFREGLVCLGFQERSNSVYTLTQKSEPNCVDDVLIEDITGKPHRVCISQINSLAQLTTSNKIHIFRGNEILFR